MWPEGGGKGEAGREPGGQEAGPRGPVLRRLRPGPLWMGPSKGQALPPLHVRPPCSEAAPTQLAAMCWGCQAVECPE